MPCIQAFSVRQRLSGVFEVNIYPVKFSVHNILSACKVDDDRRSMVRGYHGLDLNKLRLLLDDMDPKEIRKRRAAYCRLYHEASVLQEPGLGISFTNMLLLLAHHKLIIDTEALV